MKKPMSFCQIIGVIPNSDPMLLSDCTAEQVKELLLDAYKWKQREQKTDKKTYNPPQEKWLYIEEDNVIQVFYEKIELAQYIYTSDTPKDGFVNLMYEDDFLKKDFSQLLAYSQRISCSI